MSSTYLSLHYHIVFSTKNRERSILSDWRERLHEFVGGTVRGLGGIPEQIGGIDDHVRLLLRLKATHCLSDSMRELKKSSSRWVHETVRQSSFSWQEGYAGFTVSPTARTGV
jgi:REP element-mobilizing transposase RayT